MLGDADLANAAVLEYAKSIGAFPTYVHQGIPADDPFDTPAESFRNLDSINELILQEYRPGDYFRLGRPHGKCAAVVSAPPGWGPSVPA